MRGPGWLGCLLAVAALGLAACGSSGPSAEEQARSAAVEIAESDDPKEYCGELVTEHFVRAWAGGDVASCEEASVVSEDPGRANATKTIVSGDDEDHATVAVSIEGGETDGVEGGLELVKGDDRWQLDDYDEDFLRSSFLIAIDQVDEGALASPRMKACMGRQVAKLSAARVRRINQEATTDPKTFLKHLIPLAGKCEQPLAEYAADEFTKGLVKAGKSPAYVNCLHDEIEALLFFTNLTPLLLVNANFAEEAAVDGIVEGAKKACIGEP